MGFESAKGDIFITIDGETTQFAKGVNLTEEIEMSASEEPVRLYHFNDTPSVSFEVSGMNLALLNDYCNATLPSGKFTIEADIKIMIQARWHKNQRIRKKWLKRFGMKPDTVKIRMDAKTGKYHTNDGSFDFETDKYEYVWRPDQMRKGLKIEW